MLLSSVSCPAVQYFFRIISQTAHDFRQKKVIEHKTCVLIFSTTFVCFDFLYNFRLKRFSFWKKFSRIWSQMFSNLRAKYLVSLSDFNEAWIFSTYFRNILKYEINKNSSNGNRLVVRGRTDRQTWRNRQSFFFNFFLNRLKTKICFMIIMNQHWITRILP